MKYLYLFYFKRGIKVHLLNEFEYNSYFVKRKCNNCENKNLFYFASSISHYDNIEYVLPFNNEKELIDMLLNEFKNDLKMLYNNSIYIKELLNKNKNYENLI